MTRIQSIIKGSGGQLLNAILEVTLDSQVVNTNTAPDTIYFPLKQTYTINNGILDIDLLPSNYVTYSFWLYQKIETLPSYWLSDGTQYQGAVHQEGENWYTGAATSTDQKQVGRVSNFQEYTLTKFKATVPDTDKIVNFSDLIPSGITTDTLDTSVMRLASVISSNPIYQSTLRPVVFVCNTTPITDDNLGINQGSFWLDIPNNVLRVKVKKSNGVIVNGGIAIA